MPQSRPGNKKDATFRSKTALEEFQRKEPEDKHLVWFFIKGNTRKRTPEDGRDLWDPAFQRDDKGTPIKGNPGNSAQYAAYLNFAKELFNVETVGELLRTGKTAFKNYNTFRPRAKRAANIALKFQSNLSKTTSRF